MMTKRFIAAVPLGATALALYPFVLNALCELGAAPLSALLLRLLSAALYNMIFFTILLVIIARLAPTTLRRALAACFWLFLAAYTFASIYHFLIYHQLIGL